MRVMTSARLRAVGILLLEAAGLALLVSKKIRGDADLALSISKLLKRARAL